MARRSYSGNAPATTLSSGISNSATTIPVASIAGYPTGSGGNFYIVIDRGLAGEEKILCSAAAGAAFTAVGRGGVNGDGTSAATHAVGAIVEHCLTAVDADEANAHVNDITTDVHGQYLMESGFNAAHDVEGRHTFGAALGIAGTPTAVAIAAAVGTGTNPAREDHAHNERVRIGCSLTFPSQAVSDASLTACTFTVEVADTDGFIAVPSSTVTIPAGLGGLYVATFTATSAAATTGRSYVRLDHSAESVQVYQGFIETGDVTGTVSWIRPMLAASTLTARVYLDISGASTTASGRLDLYRIGA